MTERDFSLVKYEKLCTSLVSGYTMLTVRDYLMKSPLPARFAILRHDIDRIPENALRTAAIERDLGISASYYFRAKKGLFKPDVMRAVADMGHEIGYHYETLSEANGNYARAIELFRENLEQFKAEFDVKTVCMHGAPLSPYDNRDMWNHCDMKLFGLLGEAYLSMGRDVSYYSDTGGTWDMVTKKRDRMPSETTVRARTTDDLIGIVESGSQSKLYVLTHPERWSSNDQEWALYTTKDQLFNIGKKAISMVRP